MPRSSRAWLIINAGSSSIKYGVWLNGRAAHQSQTENLTSPAKLSRETRRILRWFEQHRGRPGGVGHRIVHGGNWFWRPTRLTTAVTRRLRQITALAPNHLPANLGVVEAVRRRWPKVNQWGVFDTGLYHNLPAAARWYSIPLNLARRFHIRKFGFHGLSHQWAWVRATRRLGWPVNRISGVSLHLGAGDSVTAWKNGQPVDTSMGFTPLEGLTMATRSGDLDPTIPLYLQQQTGWSAARVRRLLTEQSGLYGLTGWRDFRKVLAAIGHPVPDWPRRRIRPAQLRKAQLAFSMFVYDAQRYLASYLGLLNRPKLIVFTGAIGQNRWVRQQILAGVRARRGCQVVVIPTNEEAAIVEALGRVVK